MNHKTCESPKECRILCVGLLCVDMMNYVGHYPKEDSDNRMLEHRMSLGGNAANNVTILTQLNADVQLLSAIPSKGVLSSVADELCTAAKIDTTRCVKRNDSALPISTAIVNTTAGTRTILHQPNNFVELTVNEIIQQIGDFDQFQWVHFEGRNFDVTRDAMEKLQTWKKENNKSRPIISVEAEKIRPSPLVEQLIPLADVVFMSKDFARKHNCDNMIDAVQFVKNTFASEQATVICGWGDTGAAGISATNETTTVSAHKPTNPITDTLGAGDTFIASCIRGLSQQWSVEKSLRFAVTVAGEKCAQRGLVNLDLSKIDQL